MKTFLSICILLCCLVAFGDISRQEAYDFTVRCVDVWRSSEGSKSLEAFISDAGKKVGGRIGWSESFWFSETRSNVNYDPKKLNIERLLIRDPDSDDPMRVRLTDYRSATCLVRPEKIAVVYLGNIQKDVRVVLTMPFVSNNGKFMLCPMLAENLGEKSNEITNEIPLQKNLSTISGVEIIKIADDDNCYGFPWPKQGDEAQRVFNTNPQGCSLPQIVLHAVEPGIRATGLDHLPSGRFNVQCELLPGENGTANEKLLNAISDIFKVNIRIDDKHLWNGYRVTAPNPLPDCFKENRNPASQSSMHGTGDYEGYSLKRILSHALYNKPFELLPTNNDVVRYDVHLEVWPEAYGEMAALQQLGFDIAQAKIPERTLVITAQRQ